MGRIGINYHDVVEVIAELQGKQRSPTVDNIREILGTGSKSTIARHLRAWRMQEEGTNRIANKETLPPELVALMKGLWQRVMAEADGRVEAVQQQADTMAEKLRQQLKDMMATHAQVNQQLHNLKQQYQQLNQDKSTLEQNLQSAKEQNTKLQAEGVSFIERLKEKDARITELQQLHHQSQVNLVHYRKTVDKQELEIKGHYEQRIKELEQSSAQSINELKAELQTSQTEQQQLQQSHESLKQQQQENLVKLNQLNAEIKALQTKLNHAKKETTTWQDRHQASSKLLEKNQKQLTDTEKQNAVQLQQLATLEQQQNELKQQIKTLIQEKWQLGQEKAQLSGQLREKENKGVELS